MIYVSELFCEYLPNPLGIDVIQPRFSWILDSSERGQHQSAYQILVASNQADLDVNKADKWDSGKVISEQSINVVYKGDALESGKTYYWKVRVWDKDGEVSPYSKTAIFEMGLLKREDWKAQWISGGNLLRKKFKLTKDIARARVYVSGLGYYELRINGNKVGDHVLDPGRTDYKKRVLYVTYDVTNYLKKGTNVIGVMLGNGWYNSPKLILQANIDFTDGTNMSIVTDETWKASDGPIIADDIYKGETYDARLEKPGWDNVNYDDSTWSNAKVTTSPGGKLVSQMMQPIKVMKTIKPVALTNPKPGVYVYDMGQNFAGWAKLTVKGPRGTKVTMEYAELLDDDGMINWRNLGIGGHTMDTYILKGEGTEVYEPHFTYHGFRYVQVTGFPGVPKLDNLCGRVVYSAVESVGSFTTSNALLNQIQHNIRWSQLSNLHSIPTDCPTREKLGYGGDAQVTAEEAIYNFNMATFYEKWVNDISDAQDKRTGYVPNTAPFQGGGGGPAWGSAYVLIPWYLYLYYGDKRVLEQHYNDMKKWIDYLGSKAKDYIVSYGLGDWSPPGPGGRGAGVNTPVALTSTWYYYYDVLIMSHVAHILGKFSEADEYSTLADRIKEAFNNKFFDRRVNQYGNGSQTSNILPLFSRIVPKDNERAVLKNLVEDIMVNREGHLNTGILGTKHILEVLTDYGWGEVAYMLATQTTYPSWGYMISRGATTLWEEWRYNTTNCSHNHIMLGGGLGSWFYKALAGINVDPTGPGWRRVIIKPHIFSGLKYVNASVKTVRGMISSNWRKGVDSLILNVTLPVNSQAKVSIPKMGFAYIGGVAGITGGNENDKYVTFNVGSGSYSFEMSGTTSNTR